MKANNISLGGILTALSVLTLYFTALLPSNTLALLTIASCFIAVCIIRSNIKTASFVYIGTTILSSFIVPINYVLMYGLFFGIYGIVKYLIERLNKLSLEIVLKFIFFNVILVLLFVIINSFLSKVIIELPPWLLFIIAQPAFFIYDYALTIVITFYLEKIHKHI